MKRTNPSLPRHQGGAALLIALAFLIALTVLGIAAFDGGTLQHRMNDNFTESNRSFQAAESAVTYGEEWLRTRVVQPVPDCDDGSPCGTRTSVWPQSSQEVTVDKLLNESWWDDEGRKFGWRYEEGEPVAPIAGQSLPDVAEVPRFIIEEAGKDPSGSLVAGQGRTYELWYYRVTAKGTGTEADARTFVQSVYGKGF